MEQLLPLVPVVLPDEEVVVVPVVAPDEDVVELELVVVVVVVTPDVLELADVVEDDTVAPEVLELVVELEAVVAPELPVGEPVPLVGLMVVVVFGFDCPQPVRAMATASVVPARQIT